MSTSLAMYVSVIPRHLSTPRLIDLCNPVRSILAGDKRSSNGAGTLSVFAI